MTRAPDEDASPGVLRWIFGLFVVGVIGVIGPITPLYAQISVLGGLSQEYVVDPGEERTGTIQLRNETSEQQEVRLSKTDYTFSADGRNEYGPPGSVARSNASWIRLPDERIVVPPRETIPVTYQISMPDSGSVEAGPMKGSYWSMIMVEPIARGTPGSSLEGGGSSDAGMGLRTRVRYGVQVLTTISNTGEAALEFQDPNLVESESGQVHLHVDMSNPGSLALRPELWVELYGTDGEMKGRFEGQRYRIYPGTSVRQQVSLGDLSTGAYRVLIFADDGGANLFGVEYTLEL